MSRAIEITRSKHPRLTIQTLGLYKKKLMQIVHLDEWLRGFVCQIGVDKKLLAVNSIHGPGLNT